MAENLSGEGAGGFQPPANPPGDRGSAVQQSEITQAMVIARREARAMGLNLTRFDWRGIGSDALVIYQKRLIEKGPHPKPGGFFCLTIRRLLLKALKKQAPLVDDQDVVNGLPAPEAEDPEVTSERQRRQDTIAAPVRQAVAQLSPSLRIVAELLYYECMDRDEIARRLKITRENLRQRILRMHRELRLRLLDFARVGAVGGDTKPVRERECVDDPSDT